MADDENLAALAAKGDLPALVARLEKPGMSANDLAECDGDGWSPLSVAALCGKLECLDALLVAGAEVGWKNSSGSMALHTAARQGHDACVQRLLAAHADVNALNKDGESALISSARYGSASCADVLLRAGADVTIRDKSGKTALEHAEAMNVVHRLVALLKNPCQAEIRQALELCRARQRLAVVLGTHDAAAATTTHIIAELPYDLLRALCVALPLPAWSVASAAATDMIVIFEERITQEHIQRLELFMQRQKELEEQVYRDFNSDSSEIEYVEYSDDSDASDKLTDADWAEVAAAESELEPELAAQARLAREERRSQLSAEPEPEPEM